MSAVRQLSLADSRSARIDARPQTGLSLPRQLSFERWLSIGRQLAAAASSSAWCLGDWLVYGETRFDGRYRSALDRTSLEYKTLRNYAWVARKFPMYRRHETLSFGHHAEVAALPEPEQDFWLRKAETLGWSRNELRREVHTSLSERGQAVTDPDCPDDPDDQDPAIIEKLHVHVTADQLEVIRRAASMAQLTVATWVPLALEQAARSALSTSGSARVRSARSGAA